MQESQIAELQSVFGTILTLSKRTKTSPTPETSNYPRWTGSFRLFDFPREIRDCVYYWYLYEPKGLKYTRTGSRHLTFPFTDSRHVVLFLTSCQVYEEALEVFCRFNAIEITNTWRLEGTLRLFPDRPAQMIQRIQLIYRHTYYKSHWRRKNRVSGAWAQMILEAQVAKSYFPMLREFRALWYCSTNSFELEEGLKLQSEAPEVTTEMLLGWMRFWYREDKLIPPKWLKVDFWSYEYRDQDPIQPQFERALEMFRAEVRGDEVRTEDIEESGRKWLEEMSEGKYKKKSRKARRGLE